MKKILILIILIGISSSCFAEEEKGYKNVIGINGGGSYNINTGFWDSYMVLMTNIDILAGKRCGLRFGYETGSKKFLGVGVVIRENIGKDVFIGAAVMGGWARYTISSYYIQGYSGYQTYYGRYDDEISAIGLRGSVLCEYKFSKNVGIGIEPAYNFIFSTPSIKYLTIIGGLRFYIQYSKKK